ncbi:hypothetical protein [Cellulomonas sp. URHD0024]|uniref:hypothetical protein n=1 Tax=Cellulomonas sp. URHD0024 TaxID=1302620 RepID=UPI0004114E3C|nr:hypothetical protein [Cellulomonas sp. URHD0024]
MTVLDPANARPRTDLPWLRRRSVRPQVPAPAAVRPSSASVPVLASDVAGTSLDLFGSAAPAAPRVTPPTTPTSTTSLDLSGPATPEVPTTTSLDLRPPAAPGATPLDLSRPAAPPVPAPPTTTSLDLSSPAPADEPTRPARRRPSAENGDVVLGYLPDRVTAERGAVLTAKRPTLALTRVQSGVGALDVHVTVPQSVGDLRLAFAYRLRTGESSVLDAAAGRTLAPSGSRRPVATATSERRQTLRVDLRQVRELDRLLVLAYSATGAALAWAGALTVTTTGGARVDVPLLSAPFAGVLVVMSVLNVDGQLVLRAENELIPGALKNACTAYGFADITWVDARTPLT